MLMWGVIRDKELYAAYSVKKTATDEVARMKPGSKHKWRVTRVEVKGWDEAGLHVEIK